MPTSTSAPNIAKQPAEPAATSALPARPVTEEVVSANATMERATTDVVDLVDEEEPVATQANPATAPPTIPAGEAAVTAELVVRPTATPQGVDLLEKFQKEYAGCAVDLNADPTIAQTGRMDQLPMATHERLGTVVSEVKNFANSLIQRVQVADLSLQVSPLTKFPMGARKRTHGV